MTNEQLAILLKNYRDLLYLIKEGIESSLPDELLVEQKDLLCRPYQSAPILNDLNSFCRRLVDDANALCSKGCDL